MVLNFRKITRRKIISALLLVLLLAGIMASLGAKWYRQPPPYDRQFPITPVDLTAGGQTGPRLAVTGAKNEYLTLYFRIKGADPATLRVSAQLAPALGGAAFTFYQVRSIPFMSGARFQVSPDTLVPLNQGLLRTDPLDILATIKLSPAMAAGVQRGKIVFADGKGSFSVPLDLKVWNFALPDDLPITIMGNLWSKQQWFAQYGVRSQAQFDQVIKSYLSDMRAYKINALGPLFYPLNAAGLTPQKQVEKEFPAYHKMLSYALNDLHYRSFCIPRIIVGPQAKAKVRDTAVLSPVAKNFLPPFQQYLQRHGWVSKGYDKLMDEPLLPYYPEVYNSYALVKELAPGLKTFCAGRSPDPRLAKVIDVWAISARFYNQGEAQAARDQGQEIWLYFNRLHKVFSPAASQRLIGWILYRYKFSGYFIWAMNHWPVDVWAPNPGNVKIKVGGNFYYPSPRDGSPWPTTRLVAVRQGLQDYQYLDLLEKAKARGKVAPETFAAIQRRLAEMMGVLQPGMEFSINMPKMEGLRQSIGEILDKANLAP